ncbi:MAG TPA: AAA family ATPase [Gemmatimonadaceae bacterium]|nr:AAA family ATPase [Gemmatimonadaceae bacterium]
MPTVRSIKPDPVNEIVVLVRSRIGLIALDADDPTQGREALASAAAQLGIPLFFWTRTKGMVRKNGGPAIASTADLVGALAYVEAARVSGIFEFEGLGADLTDPTRAQYLKDAIAGLDGLDAAIVVIDSSESLPDQLRKLAALVTLPPPERADYFAMIKRVVEHLHERIPVRAELTQAEGERLIAALRGLTLSEAERVLTRVIVDDGILSAQDIAQIVAAKYTGMKAAGLLEFCPVDVKLADVADLASLKAWLATRRAVIAAPAKAAEAGLPFPRGMLLVGVPGCGKSMCAKAVAADWELPLLKLDTSGIYDKFVGESEKRFLAAIHSAERAAPAVLWIDEIEKAFSAGTDNDGGVSVRILGTFLSWLQERRGDVFVVATANDIGRLPPELVRKGRFDEIFFVDLPTADVRESIFRLHLERRRQAIAGFDLPALAAASEGFSGAEIEQVVVSALYAVFAAGGTLHMEDLRAEIGRTRPLSTTMQERIQALRDWSQGRTVSAH